MLRGTRDTIVALAGFALATVLGPSVARADLTVYSTTNLNDANTMPPAGGGAGWSRAVGNMVTAPANQTIYIAFRNDQDGRHRTKTFSLAIDDVHGALNGFRKEGEKAFRGPRAINGTLRGTRLGWDSQNNERMSFKRSYGPPCPAWERFKFRNTRNAAIDFKVTANSKCGRARVKDGNKFKISAAGFGAPEAVEGAMRITEILYFPMQSAVDPDSTPEFCTASDSGAWTTDVVFEDPDGNPRPQGGVRVVSDGTGLGIGEMYDLEFALLGPADTIYTIFAFDDEAGAYQELLLDLSAPWLEVFDPFVYQPSPTVHGRRGWKGWNDDPKFDAQLVDFVHLSPPLAVEIQQNTDIVREFTDVDTGVWLFATWLFIPGDFQTPNDGDPRSGSHVRLFSEYEDGGVSNWSVDLQVDGRDGQLKVYQGNGLDTVNVPYLVDQWVPIEAVVDLENDVVQVFYAQQPIAEYSWTAGWDGQGGGAPQIAAVDLFARGTSAVFYDDLVLMPLSPPCPEDLDGDGAVGFGDVLVVLGAWGPCGCCPADLDRSGTVDFGDVLTILSSWGPCP